MDKSNSHKYSLIFGALLIGYRFFDLSFEGQIPYTEITFNNPQSIVWALLLFTLFFSIYYLYHWLKDKETQSRFDLLIFLAVVGVAVLGDVVVVVAVVVVIVDSTGVVFLLLCSRTRYANTWFAYLDSLAFYVFLCLTVCDHRICNSLG